MAMRVMVFGNKMVTRRLTTSLAEEGIRVISASDGLDGMMALLKQGEFDLAVVDSLAEEAEAACRRINELRAIPLVLVVGKRETDWERLQSLGADGYVPENTGKAQLAARLRAVVRRKAHTKPIPLAKE